MVAQVLFELRGLVSVIIFSLFGIVKDVVNQSHSLIDIRVAAILELIAFKHAKYLQNFQFRACAIVLKSLVFFLNVVILSRVAHSVLFATAPSVAIAREAVVTLNVSHHLSLMKRGVHRLLYGIFPFKGAAIARVSVMELSRLIICSVVECQIEFGSIERAG